MPPVNHAAIASAGAIAVSVAVAAAIAIYESPELRRYTDDLRRRIAIALHSMGEGIEPPTRQPMFNRPEDAQGFLETRRGAGAEPGVDADDESRRRQREELMYWNALRLEKKERERKEAEEAVAIAAASESAESSSGVRSLPAPQRGSSFDDFLRQDEMGERGTFVFNTGANIRDDSEGLVRRRHDGVRGLNAGVYANPFADEHQIDSADLQADDPSDISPGRDEILSDIYSATTRDAGEARLPMAASASVASPPLLDFGEDTTPSQSERSATLDRDLGADEYMTAGQDDRHNDAAFSSIQAWAQGSATNFYSPLPMSPAAPISEPELISQGELTPTDSVSLAGSGEHITREAISPGPGEDGRPYDVLSESDGMLTPASWSDVGSVVSDHDTSNEPTRQPMPAS